MNDIWVIVDTITGNPVEHPAGGIRAYSKERYANLALRLIRFDRNKIRKVVHYTPVVDSDG